MRKNKFLDDMQRELSSVDPDFGTGNSSACLDSWLATFVAADVAGAGYTLSPAAVNALMHTLLAARERNRKLSAAPLFIPLKTEYFEAFRSGEKTTEFRKYGDGVWTERHCWTGRPVVISKGYGKAERIRGVITGFSRRYVDSPAVVACYGAPIEAACIEIELD